MIPKKNAAADATASPFMLKPAVGALMQLDPNSIVLSELASRTPANKAEKSYIEMRESFLTTGGNVTPGLVLRKADATTIEGSVDVLVNGYRSLEICRDLGIPLNAIVVDEMSFVEMAQYMALSNSSRKALSTMESGRFYRTCKEKNLFESQAQMARALCAAPSDVSNALYISSLSPIVIGAFGSEDDLQYRFAKPIKDALKANEKKVLAAARRLAKRQAALVNKISAAEVMLELTGWTSSTQASKQSEVPVASETPSLMGSTSEPTASSPVNNSTEPGPVGRMTEVDAKVPEVLAEACTDAEEIPASSSRALLRHHVQTKASATVRPSNSWPISLDILPCGAVNLLDSGAFQIDLEIGLGLKAQHGPALAQHISDFLADHAFGANAGDED